MLEAAAAGGARLVILRPPPVYGPGVRGNFRRLLKLAASPWPLPLAGATAPRALLGLENLLDCLLLLRDCPEPPAILHICDAEPWSVSRLVTAVRRFSGRPNRQFRAPGRLLDGIANLVGATLSETLFEPLYINAALTQQALGWRPKHTTDTLLRKTWQWTCSKP